MKNAFSIALFLLCIGAWTCDASELVNMSKLLVNGEQYANKEISFTGYACRNVDSKDGIFLTSEDCAKSNYDNGVQLFMRPNEKKCNGLVTVTGKFRFEKGTVWLESPYLWGRVEVTNYLCLSRNSKKL